MYYKINTYFTFFSEGKIAGLEYVDKPVVIKEEPQPIPPSTNELENIVKMAAADLSDDDLQNSDSQVSEIC